MEEKGLEEAWPLTQRWELAHFCMCSFCSHQANTQNDLPAHSHLSLFGSLTCQSGAEYAPRGEPRRSAPHPNPNGSLCFLLRSQEVLSETGQGGAGKSAESVAPFGQLCDLPLHLPLPHSPTVAACGSCIPSPTQHYSEGWWALGTISVDVQTVGLRVTIVNGGPEISLEPPTGEQGTPSSCEVISPAETACLCAEGRGDKTTALGIAPRRATILSWFSQDFPGLGN